MLHGDGTNGAQNNTFLDSSTNNFTITRSGNTTQGTNTPFSQAAGYWSNYFDGSSYLPTPSSSAFTIGTGDFTGEAWIYYSTQTSYQTIFTIGSSDSLNVFIRFGEAAYGNKIQCALTASTASTVWSCALTKDDFNGKWMHVALTRTSSVCRFFVNGQLQNINSGLNPSTYPYTSFTDTTDITSTACVVAANWAGAIPFYGYISNFRYVKGTSLYTSSFTPSTTPLTAVSGTQLLTCQSNNFKDNSSNNFALTVTGTPSVQPFSPFAPTSAYSTSVNGGSMYFDGTGDYLSVPSSTSLNLTGDFTIECWAYLNAVNNFNMVCGSDNGSNSDYFTLRANTIELGFVSGNYPSWIASIKTGVWNHVAVTRVSNVLYVYLNGVQLTLSAGRASESGQLFQSSVALLVGRYGYTPAPWDFNGYISNLRVVNGTAVYTTAFTPPTAPLTAITNTSLLLSGTNAGIYDNAIKNNLETVGNAQVSTSVVKYGTGSMKFNGLNSGMYLKAPPSQQYYFGTGDFTIEGWIYANNTTQNGGMFQLATTYTSSTAANQLDFQLYNGNFYLGSNGGFQSAAFSTYSANTWYHLAVSRQGTSLKFFVNGTQAGSTLTDSTNYTGTYLVVGALYDTPYCIDGYIDDFRITKGVARYTANFTPPTSAFPNQ